MNSENEKLREAFEEWFTATYTAHKLSPRQTNCGIITDGYADSRVDLCWRGWVASRAALSQQADPECERCNDTGEMDSGGVQPWGEAILVPCDCKAEPAEPAQDERDAVSRDAELYGIGFMVDGVRVHPSRVTVQYSATRPAQTEQQPEQSGLASAVRAYLDARDKGADEYDVKRARSDMRHALAAQGGE